ncbi:KNR4/SMI1 2 protein [Mycena sanguinolenta]|uniref:KNR4/SMI1 2 protein n=1 Tax=Mycena sanguinolenta TaxID=230812 RepID=A0A8H7D558_9AGAR|nr:KNR4/SMI1 2 protein [Mycena sanguinolenta]
MGWFSNLFSSSVAPDPRRGQALSSTHDAFSLRGHPDAFNPDQLNTPDLESGAGPSYTYPPQNSPKTSPSYGYVPTSAGSRQSTLLPIHHDALHTPAYPPLDVTWNRLRTWLAREYPELGDTLNYGILPQDLAEIEAQLGLELPRVVRESYLVVDGQEAESAAGCAEGLFFGLTLLPLEDVLEEWRFWREVDDDPSTGGNVQLRNAMQSIPTGWVRREYSQRGWIPLIADKAGNYVGVDLNPDEVVLWAGDGPAGWAKWLATFVDDLESGEGYEIGAAEGSGSEDDLGYESYFYDGNGRGQGDGGGGNGDGGGLRLAGEYRGWAVLEAWADRSIRKWYEMGVVTEPVGPAVDEKAEAKVNVGLGVGLPSGAEVPIPIVKVEGATSPVQTRPNPPTISVTKPPAPMPVDLPTQNDIDIPASPSDSRRSSFDDDLESGTALGMREITQPPLVSRRSSSPPRTNGATPPPPVPELIPDLLADSADSAPLVDVDITPTVAVLTPEPAPVPVPVIPTASPPPPAEAPAPEPAAPAPAPSEATPQPDGDADEADPEADVTIRLIGGGGVAGAAAEAETEESAFVLEGDAHTDGEVETDVESVSSQTAPVDAAAKKDGKKGHKKNKSSLAGLKKLGNIGVLRKKDSSASVKDAIAASAAA